MNSYDLNAQVFSAAGLNSMQAIEAMDTTTAMGNSMTQWMLPNDTSFSLHPQSVISHTIMEVLLSAPDTFEAAEFFAFLPAAGGSPWLKDAYANLWHLLESLSVLFAKGALVFGE